MARLGRGRREGARITHNQSTPTPTPLVRNRVKQTPNANDRAWLVAKAWRRRHAHIVLRSPLPLFGQKPKQPVVGQADVRATRRVRFFQQRSIRYSRAPSTPTATPLVRKRLVQTPVGNDRGHVVARAWRRKRAHVVLRAPQPGPLQPRQPQPIVSRADVRATSRIRSFQQRTARILRGVSVPTATPLVRKRLVQTPNGNDRAQTVARVFRRRRAHIIVRSNPLATTPTLRPPSPLVRRSQRPARARALVRRHVRALRSFVAPTRPQPPLIVHQRATHRQRYARRAQTITLRAPTIATGRRAARITVPRNRRAATVRAYYVRHRSRLETSTLGTAGHAPIVVTVVYDRVAAGGFLDHAAAAGALDSSTPAAGLDRETVAGGFDRDGAATGFDRSTP